MQLFPRAAAVCSLSALAAAALAASEPRTALTQAQDQARAGPSLELPAGAAARAWAGVGPETEPLVLDLGRATHAERWQAWSDALAEVTAQATEGPARARAHAHLARLAHEQGRHADAWRHFIATGAEPTTCAGLAAALVPGLGPAELARIGPGGLPPALPDGVVLTPAPPPEYVPSGPSDLLWKPTRMRCAGLAIGDAVVDIVVRREAEGIQIDLEHVAGQACTLRVRIPEPDGFEVRVEYVEWFRQETVGEPHEVRLEPGRGEPLTLYGRMLPRRDAWPTRLPAALPYAIAADGIRIVAGPDEPDLSAASAGLASAWSALLAIAVEVRTPGADPEADPSAAPSATAVGAARLVIDLSGPEAADKVRALQTLTERFLLAR